MTGQRPLGSLELRFCQTAQAAGEAGLCVQVGSVPLDLKGYHRVKFADEDVRIFKTNAGSNFATVRIREP